jgi:TolB-like protein/DNA-binding winged helix-turn-helix (wHTH) protein/tetratricopeptide (TPR) repeat protein
MTLDIRTPPPRFRIDDLEVDIGKAEVMRQGEIIPLPKLSFDLLRALINAAPGIATIDDLLQQVWPGLVVSPETVAQRVKLLRDAINDDSKRPRYILGVRGRGYRLIPAAEQLPDSQRIPAHNAQSPGAGSDAPTTDAAISSISPIRTKPRGRADHRRALLILGIAGAMILSAIAVAVVRTHATRSTAATDQQAASMASPSPSPSSSPLIPAAQNSIAVLPFADMSEKHDQEYLSDGMTEELIDMLTKVPELRVPARTSSFYFKGKQATISEIAKALGVANVLEGSVRKSGNTIRITAQLVRVDGGYHVWSETFDRQLGDIFKMQDDIAGSVVGALKVSLLGGQLPRASATTNAEAYTLYLRAQSLHFNGSSTADEQKAIDYLYQSLKLDPHYAPAWVALAGVLAADFSAFGILRHEEIRGQAHEAIDQAHRLDPDLPLGHIARGRVLYEVDWNWQAAEAEIKQAMALEPGNAEAQRLAGYIATTLGHFDEGLKVLDGVYSKDPLQPWNYIATGYATFRLGKLAETEANYRKALDLIPTGAKFHYLLGSVLVARGLPSAALEEMEKETDPGYRQVGLALAFDALGRRSEADRELAIAEQKFGNEKAYWIASVYAARKDADRAFAWLDRAFVMYDGGLLWILGDPFLDNLKADPRYEALLRKMKLWQSP